ncbi:MULTISPECIES: hypothetical protein [unclassified Nostoc]|uniref:hypothetical protein n=1 Tax=unclassified Nostoc TaxID=2593658 RepID=UPI001D244BDD|nr:hypothetical protein [Nostoc sp. JL23]MBN3878548.1 hypothetical protein [Nostoc sp. JL23]
MSNLIDAVWRRSLQANHQGEGSAVPMPNPDKLSSSEATVVRSNVQSLPMQKLKVAVNSASNRGFDFLHECWKSIRHL